MTPTDISVVVPTIGRQDALARCLEALADGTARPAEVVVVDQGSGSSADAALAGRWAARLPLVHVIAERRGLSAARNVGLRASTGDVVAFTDDDCVPDERWVEALTAAFGADDAPAAVTGPMLPLADGAPDRVPVSSRTSLARAVYAGRALPWEVGTGGNTAVRRGWLERVGGYDERLGVGTRGRAGEDLDLFRRLLAAGATIAYEPSVLCRHEGKTVSERRARRFAYGVGAGAAFGRWLRDGDAWALVALVRWTALRVRLGLRPRATVDELRLLAGTVAGFIDGVALRSWRP